MFCVGTLLLSRRGYLRELGRNPEVVRLSRHGGGRAVVRETNSLVITKIEDFRTTSVGCADVATGKKPSAFPEAYAIHARSEGRDSLAELE